MTKQLKEIEIPFGAKDSELCGWEYTIPDGMEATIVDNKIVVKKKKSEDKRIREEIIEYLERTIPHNHRDEVLKSKEWIAWLKKAIIPNHNNIDSSFIEDIKNVISEAPLLMQSDKEKMITWVENQSGQKVNSLIIRELSTNGCDEQRSAEKVEPKFKVGDWCIDNEDGTIFQIVKVLDNTYIYKTNEGKEYSCTHYSLENDAHLWTIQDAKDGDVLISKDKDDILIYKSYSVIELLLTSYISFSKKEGFCPRQYSAWDSNEFIPATKEQRDLLFAKMKEYGYTWNTEKKELLEIEEELTDFEKSLKHIMIETLECGDTHNLKADAEMLLRLAQKSTEWTEEDEEIMSSLLSFFLVNDSDQWAKYGNWLKSLKQRIGG